MAKSSTEKIRIGIEKYQYLRQRLFAVDVSADRDFQRAFMVMQLPRQGYIVWH